ncbi:glutaredoxin [Acaryochloris sp. CCMEE 5410]|uniref:glutaredoxin n=1 Tax=Acaryochloris sp. CCMEE 5410 TaxID=310037 RepID=UPI0002484193|nr:glutaredoxin [Acaryochloris sp. CCMEE 5410]KAI9130057.1 glutaredoxin [Acaryochloris sp. CCMEE 5410]
MPTATKEPVRVYRMSMPEHECPWGLKAINLLNEQDIEFEDHKLTSKEEVETFKAKHNVPTTPQIFFGEERIGGYTDLAERFDVEAESADYSYAPVIAVFSTAGLIALAASLGMTGLMGVSLSMLASLKLMDLDSFAESFEKYDLITKRFKPYAKAYPFAELIIGLGFLSGLAPLATGISSLLIGTSGGISVFKAVYIDKLALNCACVGGNTKTPLGIISFAENAIMAGMGAFLIFTSVGESQPETARMPETLPPAIIQLHNKTT